MAKRRRRNQPQRYKPDDLLWKYIEYQCIKCGFTGKKLKRLTSWMYQVIRWKIDGFLYRPEDGVADDETDVKAAFRSLRGITLETARLKRIEGMIMREALANRD